MEKNDKKKRVRTALNEGGFMCIEFLDEGIRMVVNESTGKIFRPTFTNEEGLDALNGFAIDTKGNCVHNEDYTEEK